MSFSSRRAIKFYCINFTSQQRFNFWFYFKTSESSKNILLSLFWLSFYSSHDCFNSFNYITCKYLLKKFDKCLLIAYFSRQYINIRCMKVCNYWQIYKFFKCIQIQALINVYDALWEQHRKNSLFFIYLIQDQIILH